MSDFLSNLIANMQKPAGVIQPRLGPFYGSSLSPSFSLPDERTLDFAAETEEPASGEPSSTASPWRGNTFANLPVVATRSDFSRDAQSARRHDSWMKLEMDSLQTLQPRPMPSQRESTVDSSLSFQPSREMDFKHESPSSPLTNRDVEADDSSRRSAGEEAKPHLPESKAARQVSKLSISSEREKPAASRAQGDTLTNGGQAGPLPHPDFHSAAQCRREERFDAREPLQAPEVATSAFEPMFALPQLRLDIEPPSALQDLRAAEKHEPIIRVNIGRIEVRAVVPPAPATPRSKRARSGPPLSLEDYLKQRNGGQR